MGKNLGKIIFLNAVGLTIFFSWYLPAEHGFWFTLDKSIFYYFNEQLQPESSFTYFVGLTNVRHFDIISLMAMLALYGYYYWFFVKCCGVNNKEAYLDWIKNEKSS